MNQRELASVVKEALYEGIVPWRHPFNVEPELKATFGKFVMGEPRSDAEADYGELDEIIRATGARVVHHWRVANPRFDRIRDRILMPSRSRFFSDRTYHACRIHEALHFVEAPNRVGWIGSNHQSELACEIGTGFLESYLRLPPDQDSANVNKYLPWWAMEITIDPAYLFDAITQAERSVNYLLDLRRHKEAA
jgi:antirestriction protein ArdC